MAGTSAGGPGPESDVVRYWRRGYLKAGSIRAYLHWIRRFHQYCQAHDLDNHEQLTRAGAIRFAQRYVGPRMKRPAAASTRASACHALHAWACALRALNVSLPPWCPPRPEPRLTPLLRTYLEYRRSHGASRPAPSSVIVTWHRAFCASWPAVAGRCGSSRRSISMPLLNNRLAKSRHAQWWSGVGRSD